MIGNLILRKEDSMRTQEDNVEDLLCLLLQSKKKEDQHGGHDGLTIDEVMEECKQFYLAGQETTASWLTWTVIVLAMHSEWQEKARQEVLQVCGKKEPNFESLSHLKIVSFPYTFSNLLYIYWCKFFHDIQSHTNSKMKN